MQRKWRFFLAMAAAVWAAAAVGAASSESRDLGAAEMVLEGGMRGEVPFPHRQHQDSLEQDCQFCHEMFPQKQGSIEAMKAEGTLEPKAVMNKLCTACHREYRRKGVDAGPTTCSQCHRR